jgi:hypothetical protein
MRNFITTLTFVFLVSLLLPASNVEAQSVGINFNAAAPNSSAALDIDVTALGTKKGLLMPRVTLAQRTAMNPLPAAAQGLIVYQTDGIEGFYYNTSLTTTPNWVYASPGSASSGWSLTGNSLTGASSITPNEWIGSSNAYDWVVKTTGTERMRVLSTGNVGIGTTTPGYMLHVNGNIGASSAIALINNSNAAGIGLAGQNSAAAGAGAGIGVYGATQQNLGFGLYGLNLNTTGTGILGIGNNILTYVLPVGGAGGAFYGNLQGAYGYVAGNGGYGVYGKAVNVTSAYGVVGRANNVSGSAPTSGAGGAFIGNSYGLSGYQFTTAGQTAAGYFISGDGAGGAFSTTLVEAWSTTPTHYKIWQNVVGAVSTAVPDMNGNPATLHAIETPEFYFQDFGQGKLVNGKAHIDIDPILAKNVTINDKHPLRVFIQLEGDCKGVYVTNKTATGFDVMELGGGTSNVDFQWSVTCNVADAKIGSRISKFSDLRFEPGPINEAKSLREENTQPIQVLPVQNK